MLTIIEYTNCYVMKFGDFCLPIGMAKVVYEARGFDRYQPLRESCSQIRERKELKMVNTYLRVLIGI